MQIESYIFGRIVIDGEVYTNDIIITPSGVLKNWWRKEGHVFSVADLKDAFSPSPRCLILGTGASEMCHVLPEVGNYCREMGVQLIVKPTAEAVATFNEMEGEGGIIAALHLTC